MTIIKVSIICEKHIKTMMCQNSAKLMASMWNDKKYVLLIQFLLNVCRNKGQNKKIYHSFFFYINRVKLKCLGLLFFHEEIQVAVIGHSEVALYPWIEVCWFFFSSRYLQLSMAQKSTAQTSFIYCHPFKPESLSLGCLFLSNWTGKKTCQFSDVNKQGQGKSVSHNFTWHLNYSCVCTEEIKNWAEIDWAISPLGPLHSLLSFSV